MVGWRWLAANRTAPEPLAPGPAQEVAAAIGRSGHPVAAGPGGAEVLSVGGGAAHPRAVVFVAALTGKSQLWTATLRWTGGGVRPTGAHPLQAAPPAAIGALTAYRGAILYMVDVQGQDQSVVAATPSGTVRQVFALVPPGKGGTLTVTPAGVQATWTARGTSQEALLSAGAHGALVSAAPARLRPVAAGGHSPNLFIRFVEGTRRVLGPAPVAWAEDGWYSLLDFLRRLPAEFRPRPAAAAAATPATAPRGLPAVVGQTPPPHTLPSRVSQPILPSPQAPVWAATVTDIALPATWSAATGEGVWTPVGPEVGGLPTMERTFVLPDPGRPDVRVDLVWMNAHTLRFHLMAGTQHPRSASGITGAGQVPAAALPHLVAAFDGNFKRIQGQYSGFGFRASGVTYIPPTTGLATLAIYADHEVTLGSWGTEVLPSPLPNNLLQNLQLIVDNGQITPATITTNASRWGLTVGNAIRVWRSALGITAQGNLIYAAGQITTAQDLALALQAAGAVRAMELDINSYWVTFNFYQETAGGRVVGTKLISSMTRPATRYVAAPDSRDFIYVTTP